MGHFITIPDYQTLMLPFLELCADGNEHGTMDITRHLSERFNLTEEEKLERYSSGGTIIRHRTGWARTYLKKAGLIFSPIKGFQKITERGLEVLKEKPSKVDNNSHFGVGI